MIQREQSSFRDRSGFIFYDSGKVYRAIRPSYSRSYGQLIDSGLYKALTGKALLIPHRELLPAEWPAVPGGRAGVDKVLEVEKIPFISYPYEWCFSQLKDAALLTLEVQLLALQHGMVLKDASAFNVQFVGGRPVFIDTLSFEPYTEGAPWVAYRQFCMHFLAPLALVSKVDGALRRMSELYIDGIPLALASKLLYSKTRWSPFFQMHLHYHAKLESRHAADTRATKRSGLKLSKARLLNILHHLRSGITALSLPISKSQWSDYYGEFSYSEEAIAHKKDLVRHWAAEIKPATTWDLGCNTGLFSHLLQPLSGSIMSFDMDHLAIEKFYTTLKGGKGPNILPLVMDLSNPSPAMGWAGRERRSFVDRKSADLVLALALVHHLSISNNVPFRDVVELMASLAQWLIIEYVPKEDPQAQRLLVSREDIFDDYTREGFESAFGEHFAIERKEELRDTERVLYLMKRRSCKL